VKSLHALLPFASERRILFAPITIALAASACGGSVNASPQGSGKSGQMTDDGGAGDDASADTGSGNNPGPDGSTGTSSLITVPLEECTPLVYKAGVTVGSQTFQMIIDTGSTTLGVASSKCTDCGVTPLYTPGTAAVDEGSTTTSQYGSGSWTGEIYQDSVGFTSDPTVPLKFAAITTQSMFFGPMMCQSGGGYQGIMGLDRAKAELSGTNAFFGGAAVHPVHDGRRVVAVLHGRSREHRRRRGERARLGHDRRAVARHGRRHRNDGAAPHDRRVHQPHE
jgi:hypothetical protein